MGVRVEDGHNQQRTHKVYSPGYLCPRTGPRRTPRPRLGIAHLSILCHAPHEPIHLRPFFRIYQSEIKACQQGIEKSVCSSRRDPSNQLSVFDGVDYTWTWKKGAKVLPPLRGNSVHPMLSRSIPTSVVQVQPNVLRRQEISAALAHDSSTAHSLRSAYQRTAWPRPSGLYSRPTRGRAPDRGRILASARRRHTLASIEKPEPPAARDR